MSGKLKRYISLDVLRGLAIIGVFSFHILNYSYDKEAAIANAGIVTYFFLIPLAFIAEFSVLFTCLSAIVNTISIDRKWNRIMNDWKGDPTEGKKYAFRTILKTQIIRGLFIAFCGYLAEVLLNHMLLYTIMGLSDTIDEAMKMTFRAHILWLIGIGLIITSILYLLMKKANWAKKKMVLTLILIGLCSLLIITPFLQWLYPTLGFPNNPGNFWQETPWGTNILRMILAPIIKDDFPLFPNVSIMFIGVIIGFLISSGTVEKKFLNQLFISSILVFVIGLGFYFLEDTIKSTLNSVFIDVKAGIYFMATAGSILAIIIFLYLIDIRRGRKQVKLFYFQRFGTMSLSLWMLQWLMAFPLMLIQLRLNFREHAYNWDAFVPLRDGPLFTKGLNGYGVIAEILYIIVFWSVVLWLWQQINFVGSFEWMTVQLMGGKKDHERAKISDAIINAESLSDPPQKFYKGYIIIVFFIVFLVYCVLFTAVTVLL
jgi:uncharacterized membrane protein